MKFHLGLQRLQYCRLSFQKNHPEMEDTLSVVFPLGVCNFCETKKELSDYYPKGFNFLRFVREVLKQFQINNVFLNVI